MRNNGLSVSACMNMLGLYTWGLQFEEEGGGGVLLYSEVYGIQGV